MSGTVIVGAGLMGTWHAHAVRSLGRRVLAVVDSDIARAQALAQRHGATAGDRLDDALARKPLVVHVCTAPESHVPIVSASLAAGAHCLVEKPFALDAAAARRMLELAADRGLLVCPVHQFLFQRGVRRVQELLPRFGPLLHGDFVACSAGAMIGEQTNDSAERRHRLALDILPHPLSLVRRLVGGGLDVDGWTCVCTQPGEARITGTAGRVSVGMLISATGRPTRNTARFIGERGTMHVDLFHGFATFEPPAVSRLRKITRPFTTGAASIAGATVNLAGRLARREPAYPGLRELVHAFYEAAESGRPAPIRPDETGEVADAAERLGGRLSAMR